MKSCLKKAAICLLIVVLIFVDFSHLEYIFASELPPESETFPQTFIVDESVNTQSEETQGSSAESESETVTDTEGISEGETETEIVETVREISLTGFHGFDMYGQEPYQSITLNRVDGVRSYLFLPSDIQVCLQEGDKSESLLRKEARWTCEDWDTPDLDVYRFTLSLEDDLKSLLSESLKADLIDGTAVLPFVDVHISDYQAKARSALNQTVVRNNGLVYIPGTNTSTYDFEINGKRAFCMQHPIPSAEDGSLLTPQIYDDINIQKSLYYGFGGVEPYPAFSCDEAGIVLTSLALSYFYMGDYNFAPTWGGGAYGSYSRSIGFDKFLDYIKAQPFKSGNADLRFSKTNLRAHIENDIQKTENVTFSYIANEFITLNIPEKVSLVNLTQGNRQSKSGMIYSGDEFYFEAPLSQLGTWNSGVLYGSRGKFAPIVCLTGPSTQDIGYGEWIEDTEKTASLSIEWIETREVEVLKHDVASKTALSGATLQLWDTSGNVIDTWVSQATSHKVAGLKVGNSYVLKESAAPAGYLKADPIEFKIDEKEGQHITMTDDYTKVEFIKRDAKTHQPLPGARLQLTDSNKKVIDTWVTDESWHRVDKLTVGATYTLSEIGVPAGYVTAASISFVVKDTNQIQTIEMEDDYTKVDFYKTDIENGKFVPGAKLSVYGVDAQGKVVTDTCWASWVTTEQAYHLEYLPVGDYILREEKAPGDKGYVTCSDVKFKVIDQGEVQKVEMKDDHTKIEVMKIDDTTGKFVSGAKLAIYPVNDQGQPDLEHCFKSWVTDEKAFYIDYIPVGKYILRELEAPVHNGYVTSKDIHFFVEDREGIQKVQMADGYTRTEIIKKASDTGNALPGAVLRVLDMDGKVMDEWTSDINPHTIQRLVAGNEYILREMKPADGYTTAEDVKFTVKDTLDVQKVIMTDMPTRVIIEKRDLEEGKPLEGARLQLLDDATQVVEEWVSEETPYVILKLVVGKKYTLKELQPPVGYATAADIEFIVEDRTGEQKVSMDDDITKISIEKLDGETKKPLSGATLQVKTMEGDILESWVSEEEGHLIKKLGVGTSYILEEVSAPQNYAAAKPVTFLIEDSPSLQKIIMDNYQEVPVANIVKPKTGDYAPLRLAAAAAGFSVLTGMIVAGVKIKRRKM